MDVKVNDQDWTGLNDEAKNKIKSIINAHFHGMNVAPGNGLPSSRDTIKNRTLEFNFTNPICTAACGVAEAAAVAACSALSGPAVAVCVAAAHAAADICRSRC